MGGYTGLRQMIYDAWSRRPGWVRGLSDLVQMPQATGNIEADLAAYEAAHPQQLNPVQRFMSTPLSQLIGAPAGQPPVPGSYDYTQLTGQPNPAQPMADWMTSAANKELATPGMMASLFGPIAELSPATWKAMEQQGLSHLGKKMINTLQNKGQEAADWRALGMAAEDTGHSLKAVHVTNDPSVVENRLAKGLPLKEGRREGKYGELGTGLYGSGYPEYWMGRATQKWDFLTKLDDRQFSSLADYLKDKLDNLPKGYITSSEREFGERLIREARHTKYAEPLLMLSDQPFNIRDWWKPEVLTKLNIKPSKQPIKTEMEARGNYIQIDQFPTQEQAMKLNKLGFNGAWTPSGFSTSPQLVVWDNNGIVKFGKYVAKR